MPDLSLNVTRKFVDPQVTIEGVPRGRVPFERLDTLWINTGTLCNITCANCYIESSPRNDRLTYISAAEVDVFVDEIEREGMATREIGFTGGEPFMNPEFLRMLAAVLERGFEALVLTNAMKPMLNRADDLAGILDRYGARVGIRVSLDHYTRDLHEKERGSNTWEAAVAGLAWLGGRARRLSVAGRTCWGESLPEARAGYASLFKALGVSVDAEDPNQLILFPEMDAVADVPEISIQCWDILGKTPSDVMCATSRMVVKRKGAAAPVVLACTLIPYDDRFELGASLSEARRDVVLNHPHCSKFCVLGGGSCSSA